jgi:starch synthase
MSKEKLKVLFISAEVDPYAKTGGLADVAGSLPKELIHKGIDARVAMPKYGIIKRRMHHVTDFPIQMADRIETCIIRELKVSADSEHTGKLPIYFIDSYQYYDRDGIYCFHDDGERFIFFCRAVLEMLPQINFKPDIIHCNDWHTGPVCLLLKEKYFNNSFYNKIATVFTIHNLEYQGHFPRSLINFLGVGDDIFIPEKVEFYGVFNFMKAGLVYADIINTVSQRYAEEIKTANFGERLEGLLLERAKDLYGIANGISYDEFNPAKDKRIHINYDSSSAELKKENKYKLQEEMRLPVKDVPVFGLVSRLSSQKGLDLIIQISDELFKKDVQFVLLGIGDPYYENSFRDLHKKYPDKVAVNIVFNAALAQRIYSGSDIFLMPSKFEPCGLGQMISFRYGTIPIVRKTGGLGETVFDIEEDKENGNGFVFEKMDSDALYEKIESALDMYNNEPETWKKLVIRALQLDYSWKRASKKYLEIYDKALKKKMIKNI